MSGVEVIIEELDDHPWCPHGPTILFSRSTDGVKRRFFACSACRDRKLCPFFLYEDERGKYNAKTWNEERKKFINNLNHRKLYLTLNQIKNSPPSERGYCHTCSGFHEKKFWDKHVEHEFVKNITDRDLQYPSEFLSPLEDAKKEAQFLFSKTSVTTLVNIFKQLKYKKVLNIGTPRIHEFITNTHPEMSSLLLDIDRRYHSFYSPLEFCWYNSFNHHFFTPEAEEIFLDFIHTGDLVVVMDPPFGGRVEPLAHTLKRINEKYRQINHSKGDLPVFWIFPYFMEPQILNSLPDFTMLDYKVDYDNHPLFQDGDKARKFGSPVRIFTNVDPSKIELPADQGYKYCPKCTKWVAEENRHCEQCDRCTSKDGRTYVHCFECERCVKPSWQHCKKCSRCAQPDHKCQLLEFTQNCFHCKQSGHKKRDCPLVDRIHLHKKRKTETKKSKKRKLNK